MPSKNMTYAAVGLVVAAVIIGAALVYNPLASNSPQQNGSGSSSLGLSSQSSALSTSTAQQSSLASTGGTGTLAIYLTDAPPGSQTLKYVLVNVTSLDLAYQGSLAANSTTTSTGSSVSSNSTTQSTSSTTTATTSQSSTQGQNLFVFTVPTNVGTNVNLTALQGQSLFLGATQMPAGNVTSITLNITGAKAFYTDGSSEQLKVAADGKLMIPIRFGVQSNGSTSLTLDIMPNLIHLSQGGVLTPVIHATAVEKGPGNNSTTHTMSVTTSTTASGTSTSVTTATQTSSS